MRRSYVVTAAAIVGLWAHGRYRRSTWTTIPTARCEPHDERNARTAIFVLTGAFNGPPHTERLVSEYWQYQGDVFVIDYPEKRYGLAETVSATVSYIENIIEGDYDTVVIDAYSKGGLVALLAFLQIAQYDRRLAEKIELHVSDMPSGPQHLLIPGGKPIPRALVPLWLRVAPYLRYVHVGPLFNLLSPLATKLFFVPMDEADREDGIDASQFERHMSFLRGNMLSVIVEQIAAIAAMPAIQRPAVQPKKITYRRCAKDLVIDADASFAAVRELFPGVRLVEVGSGTSHVAIVEGHESFMAATKTAYES